MLRIERPKHVKEEVGMEKIKIAVLVSGGGTNLQALIDAQAAGVLKSGKLQLVLSNKADAYALKRAKKAGIPTACVTKEEWKTEAATEEQMLKVLRENKIELVILAGFLSIISANFVGEYQKRIINVHPSLIPSFCGKGFYGLKVHKAALEKGVKITGATVHYVNEIADDGEIILQKAVCVKDGDTPEILQERVMKEAEWELLPQAAQMVSAELQKAKELKQ